MTGMTCQGSQRLPRMHPVSWAATSGISDQPRKPQSRLLQSSIPTRGANSAIAEESLLIDASLAFRQELRGVINFPN